MKIDWLPGKLESQWLTEVDPDLIVQCGPTIEDSYQATRQLLTLSSPPTALLTINDFLAIGALRAIKDLGMDVPRDISLFGYDNVPLAKYLVPNTLKASKDGEKMGRKAVNCYWLRLPSDRPAGRDSASCLFDCASQQPCATLMELAFNVEEGGNELNFAQVYWQR
ncbi:MAG: substrate-binding domain-containing protein [Chloroflexota bacterium]